VGKAKKFYALITASIFAGLLIAALPVDTLKLLFYSQVLSGAIAPLLILTLLYICNNRKIMGQAVNSLWDNFWGAAAALVMIGSLVFLAVHYFF
jgi:Mn2+/Fe2+ NRAMP family transporter